MRSRPHICAFASAVALATFAGVAQAATPAVSAVAPETRPASSFGIPLGDRLAPELPDVPVESVVVRGLSEVEEGDVLALLATVPGAPMSPDVLAADLALIWGMRVFEDVRILWEPDGARVVFLVVERPTVGSVRVTGNRRFSRGALDEVINIKRGHFLDEDRLRRVAERIRKKYEDEGYALAEVTWEVTPSTPPAPGASARAVDVLFQVEERARLYVREVRFIGNVAATADELRELLDTRSARGTSRTTGFGTLSKTDLERDRDAILEHYYSLGFLNVEVTPARLTVSRNLRWAFVTFIIDEGHRYRTGRISVWGPLESERREEFEEVVGLWEGDWFDRKEYGKALERLLTRCRDAGHAWCEATPITEIDPEERLVHVAFEIVEGPKVTVHRIEIRGNRATTDRVIRERLELHEGDLYSATAVERSRAALQELGGFDKVDVSSEPGPTDDTLVLVVQVKEKRFPGGLQPGLTFGTGEGPIITLSYTHRNFLGRGHIIRFFMEVSSLRQLFSLSFVEPRLFGSRWRLSADLFSRGVARSSFATLRTGGSLELRLPVTGDVDVFARYALYDLRLQGCGFRDCLDLEALRIVALEGRTSLLSAGVVWSELDSKRTPKKGVHFSVGLEGAAPFTGSVLSYSHLRASVSGHLPVVPSRRLAGGVILRGYARFALVWVNSRGREVPLSERVFAGGAGSIRGFRPGSLGPLVRAAGAGPGDPLRWVNIGGIWSLAVNVELEFPLGRETNLKGLVFFDGGGAFGGLATLQDVAVVDGAFSWRRVRVATGVGVRWLTPLGPIRFEIGIPLWRDSFREEPRIVFDFTFGYDL